MKILFPRPVKVNSKEYYPPDYKLASLAEENGELYVLSDYYAGDFATKEHIKKSEHCMLFAIVKYGLKLIEALCKRYKEKYDIPEWKPNVPEEETQ